MRILLKAILGAALLGLAGAVAAADWFRYTPPPLGRTVFDQVLTDELAATLRLPKIGRYYVELIRERGSAGDAEPPLAAHLELRVARGERPLLSRALDVAFAPGERSRTLLWLNVPDTLPDRTKLALALALSGPSAEQLAATPLRLQITRKLELPSYLPR